MLNVTLGETTITFAVRVQPRAPKSAIVGAHDGTLKIRLAAPPVDGAANEELTRLLAKLFDVKRADVEILSGTTAKQKLLRIHNVNPTDAEQILLAALNT